MAVLFRRVFLVGPEESDQRSESCPVVEWVEGEKFATVLVGTCSWTDPTLLACGRFYPPGAKTAEARLRYYASQFSLVEVDSSYYSLPQERTARLWASRTPEGFRFDVKAFRLFTHHPTPQEALPAVLT